MAKHLAPVSTKYWLENSPRRSRRKSSRGKRRPPKGFSSWSAYMDSIRPTSKGGTMARRRRRRRRNPAVNRPRRRRRRRNPQIGYGVGTVGYNRPRRRRRRRANGYVANRRRRRRRHTMALSRRRYRRNPRLSIRGLTTQVKNASVCALQIVGGKVVTRVIRNYIPGGKPVPGAALTPTQIAIELGSATLVGYLAAMVLGARAGEYFMAGGFAGVIESLVKTYKVPVAADALGDEGDPNVITVPAHMAGYVRESLAGYVQDSGFVNGPGLGAYGPANPSGIVADSSGPFAEIGIPM